MASHSNEFWEIRHYLSSAVDDLLYGQLGTTGATTTKSYATFLFQPDDYYQEHQYEAYVYLGTNHGLNRRITDWDLSAFLYTVHTAYDAACDATSYAELHHIFSADEYNKAINLAIESMKGKYTIEKIDETVTLVADDYEYTIPDGFTHIHRITTENAANTEIFYEDDEIDPRDWMLISPRKLKLREGNYSIDAGKDLRIEGQGEQATLLIDTDVCKLPLDWLVQKAITRLPQNKIQSNGLDATYRQAVIMSANEPKKFPNPRAKAVKE